MTLSNCQPNSGALLTFRDSNREVIYTLSLCDKKNAKGKKSVDNERVGHRVKAPQTVFSRFPQFSPASFPKFFSLGGLRRKVHITENPA